MLDKLRESSRSFGSYVIFAAIILVFVIYFGPGGQSCGDIGNTDTITWAAKVNGAEIPVRDFQMEYDALVGRFRAQMGDDFDPEMMGIRASAVDNLVTRRLLVDQAKLQGIAISDAEVAEALQEEPAFQKDGHFDFETYRAVLRNWQGITPARYEDQLRNNLLIGKILSQLKLSAKVTDDEVQSAFESEGNLASLTFVRVAPSDLMDEVEISEEAIAGFLATEEGKQQVADQYEATGWRFSTPKRVKAQHILIKVDEDAPAGDVDEAREKILAAKAEIEGGADFGEVATRVSEDGGTRAKGGDLGLFGPGSMVKPFEDAAMAMEVGEISEPVRSRFGFHLIKVNEVQPATEQSLEDVQDELARELLAGDVAKLEAKVKADAILVEAQDADLLTLYPMVETEPGEAPQVLEAMETGPFQVTGDFVPRLGADPELLRAVADADEPGLLPQVFEMGDTYVVAQLTSREKPDLSKLDDQKKSELRERLLLSKQNEAIESFVARIKEDAKVETNERLLGQAW